MASDGRIYISKDVLFDEFSFPYQKLLKSETAQVTPTTNPATIPLIPQSTPHIPHPINSPPPELPDQIQPVTSPNSTDSHQPTTFPEPVTQLQPITTSESEIPHQPAPSQTDEPHPNVTLLPQIVPSSTNSHPMVTRSKTGNLKPWVLLTQTEPSFVKQALASPEWLAAMQAEYNALLKNNAWTLVDLPPHRQAIGCKWVFRVKENPDGTTKKYKARLVAKGFHQQFGFDFREIFSPVVKPVTIRTILTFAFTYQWTLQQIDVNNVFLNGYLTE